MGDAVSRPSSIPSPKRIRHGRSLVWWGVIVGAFLLVRWGQTTYFTPLPPPEQELAGTEREAFVSFLFGKVSEADPRAIPPSVLRAQLEHLKDAGYVSIRLEDVAAFYREGRPLPARPVLLAFEEAHRETVELVDPILEDLGMNATAFVSVDALAEAHLNLVSLHRLEWMVRSRRWGVGIGACREEIPHDSEIPFPTDEYRRHSSRLESWTGRPVLAIGCHRSWAELPDAEIRWEAALEHAEIPLGFVVRPTGPNYRDESPLLLRAIRVHSSVKKPDALVARMEAYAPRRTAYRDDFATSLGPAWMVDWGRAAVEKGTLRLEATDGDAGAVVSLGGTERWRDVDTEVELATKPEGQFWLYARRNSPSAFLRLGVVEDRIVLQKSDRDGRTRQLRSLPLGSLPVRLRLRVIGRRATAFVNGRSILDRPAALPPGLSDGAIALVVWNEDGAAAARTSDFRAEPMAPRFAVVDPVPASSAWASLRAGADDLHGVSPRELRWRNGKVHRAGTPDLALRIFAHHHHVVMLPALTVDDMPAAGDVTTFSEAVRHEATQEKRDGLHVILPADPGPELLRALETLRLDLAAQERELLVTLERDSPQAPWMASMETPRGAFPVAIAPLILTRPVPAG